MGDADNGGDYACVGQGRIGKISVASSQLCYETKTALKNVFQVKEFLIQDAHYQVICKEIVKQPKSPQ